jgi:hypothetical protein
MQMFPEMPSLQPRFVHTHTDRTVVLQSNQLVSLRKTFLSPLPRSCAHSPAAHAHSTFYRSGGPMTNTKNSMRKTTNAPPTCTSEAVNTKHAGHERKAPMVDASENLEAAASGLQCPMKCFCIILNSVQGGKCSCSTLKKLSWLNTSSTAFSCSLIMSL